MDRKSFLVIKKDCGSPHEVRAFVIADLGRRIADCSLPKFQSKIRNPKSKIERHTYFVRVSAFSKFMEDL